MNFFFWHNPKNSVDSQSKSEDQSQQSLQQSQPSPVTTSQCPHCGHQQKESSYLISTFCRACGMHYSAIDAAAAQNNNHPSSSLFLFPKKWWGCSEKKPPITHQTLTCYRCTHQHRVSVHAQITICPQCNTSITLTDVSITHSTSQEVDTRGKLLISPGGYLEGGTSICGSAIVKGKIGGTLICEQGVRLFGKGRCRAKFIAKQVVVERGAHLYLHFPLYTEELIVYGQLAATIFCRGMVYIYKKGFLEGPVCARGIEVSRHGRYSGSLQIQHRAEEIPSLNTEITFPAPTPDF